MSAGPREWPGHSAHLMTSEGRGEEGSKGREDGAYIITCHVHDRRNSDAGKEVSLKEPILCRKT